LLFVFKRMYDLCIIYAHKSYCLHTKIISSSI
jgi:hypothetical protein